MKPQSSRRTDAAQPRDRRRSDAPDPRNKRDPAQNVDENRCVGCGCDLRVMTVVLTQEGGAQRCAKCWRQEEI